MDVIKYIERTNGIIEEAIFYFYTINDKAANYTCELAKRSNVKIIISDLMNSKRQKERLITQIFDNNNVEIVFCHNHARIEQLQITNSKEHYEFILSTFEKLKTEFQINKRY